MKLVILGAGASYDSFLYYHDEEIFEEWRPPLSNEIFQNRPSFLEIIKQYPSSIKFYSRLSTLSDLEDFFQNQYELSLKANGTELETHLINLRFFLQHFFLHLSSKLHLAGPSNYEKLISLIEHYISETNEDVLIVNFNYDLLVEQVLMNHYYTHPVPLSFPMGAYLGNKIKLVKPHGSCNWVSPFEPRAFDLAPKQTVWQYLMSRKLKQADINKVLHDSYYSTYNVNIPINTGKAAFLQHAFPQIFIPLKSKDDFTMPKEQLSYLEGYLPKVKDILIIGWKGNEVKFNETLKTHMGNNSINVQVVNGPRVFSPEGVIDKLDKYIQINKQVIFDQDAPISPLSYKLGRNELSFVADHCLPGSFSSFLLNVEQGNFKSIFN